MNGATVLVTGGAGFVGSNLVRALLERDTTSSVVILDRAVDELAASSLAPYGERVTVQLGDITDPQTFVALPQRERITHVVHGAMIAHVPAWEQDDPSAYVRVNILGTVNVLEYARRQPTVARLLYLSSGAVYGEPTAASPEASQPESGPFNPSETYGISKHTSELLARRYADLFALDVRIARLSWVFGPMERATSGRTIMSPPHAIVSAIVAERALTVTRRSLDAVGDFLSAEDVAAGVVALLMAPTPEHVSYNIALGQLVRLGEVLELAGRIQPAFHYTVVDDDQPADLDHDPTLRRARWNAYAIQRMQRDVGWRPRPLAAQLRSYFDWALANPATRWPTGLEVA